MNKTKQTHMMAKKIDKHLEEKLFKHLDKLRKKIDWIGDKDLRQKLDEHATEIHNIIKEAVNQSDELPAIPSEPKKPECQYSREDFKSPTPPFPKGKL